MVDQLMVATGTTLVANGKPRQNQTGSPVATVADDIVLVGSEAAQLGGLYLGHCKDKDFICTKEAFLHYIEPYMKRVRQVLPTKKGMAVFVEWRFVPQIIEAEFVDGNVNSQELLAELVKNSTQTLDDIPVACLDDLYMLKESHKYLCNSPHFLKTRQDIMKFRAAGCTIRNPELFKQREKDTYDYSHPNLKQNKEQFFTDEVEYIYDHDSIHEAMAHYDRPAYTFYAVEGEEVLSSKEKFFECYNPVRLMGVLEEAYVLALERSVIPYETDPDKAFEMALMKICTSITSGWFREYAWENYDEVMLSYKWDYFRYVDRFKAAWALGNIKPFKGEK